MRRKEVAALLLTGLLLTTACATAKEPESMTEAPKTETIVTEPSIVVETEPVRPSSPQIAGGKLVVADTGLYSGLCPENGSDEEVTNAAALLVVNVSDQTCQYCTLEYTVDGAAAVFNISELPAGKAAWVLEANGMTAEAGASFEYQKDTSIFREADARWVPGITVTSGEGSLTVTNESETDYSLLTIYYKLTYGENTYLGGIAYRVTVDGLTAGESKTLTAGHFFEGAAELVGIYTDGSEMG